MTQIGINHHHHHPYREEDDEEAKEKVGGVLDQVQVEQGIFQPCTNI